MFDSLLNQSAYVESTKQWYVELIRSDMFWYDLVVNPPHEFDTKNSISQFLKSLTNLVEQQLDKRFIYFISARKKLLFSTKKKPKYSLFGDTLHLYLEVGKEKKLKKITTVIYDMTSKKPIKPHVSVTERFITFTHAAGNKISIPIHDFLSNADIDLGINSKIYYIGYTKNPWKRPIDGSHRGLSETLYRVPNEDNDIFIYYNLFKVTTSAENTLLNLNFAIANSMLDEIKVDEEGLLLEKSLILYFQAESQMSNHENEKRELENSLIKLASQNKITAINMHYEMENPSEYYRFYSSKVSPKDKHVFTCKITNDELVLHEGSNLYDQVFGSV